MATDFIMRQHLNMSPSAQIKNLRPEILDNVPPEDEWRLGRIWFNNSIGKFQTISYKMDPNTGLPKEPKELEIILLGSDEIGFTRDGEYYPDGLFEFSTTTKISTAVDEINEALKDLAPAEASPLHGDLDIIVENGFKNGRIPEIDASSPVQFDLKNLTPGTYINYIINNSNLIGYLPTEGFVVKNERQQQFGKADQGLLNLIFDDAAVDDGISLGNLFYENARDYFGVVQGFDYPEEQQITLNDGSQISITANPNKNQFINNTGSLIVKSVKRYNDFKKWQIGYGSISIGNNSNQDFITPGKHSFFVEHSDVLGGPYKTNNCNIYYDPNTEKAVTTINTFDLLSGNQKFLSGIPFYYQNIKFKVNLIVENAFKYTYTDYPTQLSALHTNASLLKWNSIESSLNNKEVPLWNDIIEYSDVEIEYTQPNYVEKDIILYAKSMNVTTGFGNIDTKSLNILIDTYSINGTSTNLIENFNDENYRIDGINFDNADEVLSSVGSFNSNQLLSTNQGQIFLNNLQKAKDNYSLYNIDIDYSGFKDDIQYYYRPIIAQNKANSNGIIKISTHNLIGVDFEAFIKLPGITGWLDLNKLYDVQTFNNEYQQDGTGCATNIKKNINGYIIKWTVGTNSTADTNFLYVLKIVLLTETTKIEKIAEISENWS